MFPEAFPLPQEQGGTSRWIDDPTPQGPRPSSRCEYHTAISAAFQLELAAIRPQAIRPQVDTNRRKVETFLDSRANYCEQVGEHVCGGNPNASFR
jgi:hypothetical protein